jgi:hypothetical protein
MFINCGCPIKSTHKVKGFFIQLELRKIFEMVLISGFSPLRNALILIRLFSYHCAGIPLQIVPQHNCLGNEYRTSQSRSENAILDHFSRIK